MENFIFFTYLADYLKHQNIEGKIIYDKFSNEKYAALGKDNNSFPRIFLDKEKSVGNIDIFSLEFYNPTTQQTIEKQRLYAQKLITFLETVYSEENFGYILMRKTKTVHQSLYKQVIKDSFADFLRKNHKIIISKNLLYPYLNTKGIEWAVYSKNKGVEAEYQRISLLENSIQKVLEENDSRVHSLQLINSNHIAQKIMFKVEGVQYYISLIPGDEITFELRISAHPDYATISFSDPNSDIKSLVKEIELINRLKRLFEDN